MKAKNTDVGLVRFANVLMFLNSNQIIAQKQDDIQKFRMEFGL